ncbi:microtubule-associated protein RP/EB family member 1 [Drosophila ananassae]|uniref:microtubule-associated protein RP/EB family member 1 n=1 Tax=Drosophila ananassae TaxID=7217 RepID=UPI0013A5DAE3|nr:microtubule-associated protein RP/EB family member 1 [Drosophila ananassae]
MNIKLDLDLKSNPDFIPQWYGSSKSLFKPRKRSDRKSSSQGGSGGPRLSLYQRVFASCSSVAQSIIELTTPKGGLDPPATTPTPTPPPNPNPNPHPVQKAKSKSKSKPRPKQKKPQPKMEPLTPPQGTTRTSVSYKSAQWTNETTTQLSQHFVPCPSPQTNAKSLPPRVQDLYCVQQEEIRFLATVDEVVHGFRHMQTYVEEAKDYQGLAIGSVLVAGSSRSIADSRRPRVGSVESLFRSRVYNVNSSELMGSRSFSSSSGSYRRKGQGQNQGSAESEYEKDMIEESEDERFYRRMMKLYATAHTLLVDFTKHKAIELRDRRTKQYHGKDKPVS